MVGNPGTRERATEARGHGHNKRRSLGEVTIITAKTGTSPRRHPARVLHTPCLTTFDMGLTTCRVSDAPCSTSTTCYFLCGSARGLFIRGGRFEKRPYCLAYNDLLPLRLCASVTLAGANALKSVPTTWFTMTYSLSARVLPGLDLYKKGAHREDARLRGYCVFF